MQHVGHVLGRLGLGLGLLGGDVHVLGHGIDRSMLTAAAAAAAAASDFFPFATGQWDVRGGEGREEACAMHGEKTSSTCNKGKIRPSTLLKEVQYARLRFLFGCLDNAALTFEFSFDFLWKARKHFWVPI